MLRRPSSAVPFACLAVVSMFSGPLHAEDDWCAAVAGGPSGGQDLALDLSAAHAAIRFFGTADATAASDQALALALDPPDALENSGTTMLQAYAEKLVDVCLVATDNRPLGPVKVVRIGAVAVVRPGTGPVVLPPGTLALAVDLRHLPDAPGLRAALEAAVAPSLDAPMPRGQRQVRVYEGMPAESAPYYTPYYQVLEANERGPMSATGAPGGLPLAFLTGGPMPPDAAEMAITFREARKAWIIGADLLTAVAESRWQGVGARESGPAVRDPESLPGRRRGLGKWGLAFRVADLYSNGGRWADRVPADVPSSDPLEEIAGLPSLAPPPPLSADSGERPRVRLRQATLTGQPAGAPLGDARAALLAYHGAIRLFDLLIDYVGATPDEGRAALDARLLEVLAGLGSRAPDGSADTIRRLRRLGEAARDGGIHVDTVPSPRPPTGLPLMIEETEGEPVVLRSLDAAVLPGDRILSVDGRSADACYAEEESITSAPTEGLLFQLATFGAILRHSAPVEVMVEAPDGSPRAVTVPPVPPEVRATLGNSVSLRPTGPLTDLGAPDLLYYNFALEGNQDYNKLLATMGQARASTGLIIDMRGFSFYTDPYRAAYFLNCRTFDSPMFEYPVIGDGVAEPPERASYRLEPAGGAYCGPLVVLVGPRTNGAMETLGIMLEDAHRARVVGRGSAGSDANSTNILLPGGLAGYFSGLRSLHADLSRFHGIGMKPFTSVEPQAADYASGFDRTLDAGIREMRVLLSSPCPVDPDADIDGDGVCGNVDNCRTVANPVQEDRDGDRIGDACDPCPGDPSNDGDGDHICDDLDNCPGTANPGQGNADGDRYGDACDLCPATAADDNHDSDGDGRGDACDACPFDPQDDGDGDGRCAASDNCPLAPNPAQSDADGDGFGDACDPCPADATNDQADRDGVCRDLDNCPNAYNPNQADADDDGLGDACDNCPGAPNPGQEDGNTDGAGDACQPRVEILAITEDGGVALEVTATAADPQGEPLTGSIRIIDTATNFALDDFLADPDCGAPLAPEGLAGRGVVFAQVGGTGFLVDADTLTGELLGTACGDGQPDYTIALGACGRTTTGPDVLLDLMLARSALPGPVCIARLDGSAAFDFTLSPFGSGWNLSDAAPPPVDQPWQGAGLPAQIPLQGLVPGKRYRLEISATDGVTPTVRVTREFLYQGESVMRFTLPAILRPRPGVSG